MSAPALDWSGADVRDATLTVPITGERSEEWDASFSLALTLLAGDTPWSQTSVDDGTVTVPGVRPGDEDQLRFMLEGAVQQAGADQAAADRKPDDNEDGAGDGERDDAEQQMTDRLRGFAGSDADADEHGADDEQ